MSAPEETSELTESITERVVEAINNAIVTKDAEKVKYLMEVQELLVHHDILDNFLDEVLGFQTDKAADVRKFVVGFIEASCKKDPETFSKLIVNLNYALVDANANVVKRAVQATTQLYKYFLKWISKVKISEVVESTWEVWCQIKQHICGMLETSENEGVKTQCVKFMEMLIIAETRKDKWVVPSDDISVEDLKSCKLVVIEQLEDEAKLAFDQLIQFHGAAHISSVNLMASMQSLVMIARQRAELYMPKVITALEALHVNLPPTLATSQVSSVRKFLKLQLLILLKHPLAASFAQYQSQIVQLLTDLGATQSEIARCFQDVRKRGYKVEQASLEPVPKRIKLDHDEEKPTEDSSFAIPKVTKSEAMTAIDATAEDLIPHLSVLSNVTDIVLVSLLSLPEVMPTHFQASYTPVAAAGTVSQVEHLARLLAAQLTAVGLGKGVEDMVSKATQAATSGAEQADVSKEQHQKIAIIIGRGIAQEYKKQEQQLKSPTPNTTKVKLQPTGKVLTGSVKFRQLNLSEITKELSEEVSNKMVIGALERILETEETRLFLSTSQLETRTKILSHLATQLHGTDLNVLSIICRHAFMDIRARHELLFSLIYDEYLSGKKAGGEMNHYNICLVTILAELIEATELRDRDHLLPKFFIEAPLLTQEAISILKRLIIGEPHGNSVTVGITILKTLIEKKRLLREELLTVLLELCIYLEKPEVRSHALKTIKSLHEVYGGDIKEPIEKFALDQMKLLLEDSPPPSIVQSGTSNPTWTEDVIKLCLLPYLGLLPSNHKLIHDLAEVYVGTVPDIKRAILRVLETPVKGMGMGSPELLLLVENCPKGAETLVTRIIHVLTDKQPPSSELVSRVRDLYHKRVPDVRFLIPVLNGLSKKEVIKALPKLIKLNPVVVKEVFNRLLGGHEATGAVVQSPLTPADLLIALHNIDAAQCDMKTIIKATSLCFGEKNIYTAEVLAVVMQFLMDQNPLPTLLMRTVIQSLSLYPRLIGFVMNVLQRLIPKQVWKQKKVWEGFIKCCQRTKPQSFQVLLQLPAAQLQTVFESSPELKPALLAHINSFTDTQRSHIPQSILDVISAQSSVRLEEIPAVKSEFPEPMES